MLELRACRIPTYVRVERTDATLIISSNSVVATGNFLVSQSFSVGIVIVNLTGDGDSFLFEKDATACQRDVFKATSEAYGCPSF